MGTYRQSGQTMAEGTKYVQVCLADGAGGAAECCVSVVYQRRGKWGKSVCLACCYLFSGAFCSLGLYYLLDRQANLFKELGKMNIASYALGGVIVGLELGFTYAYKAGWQVSTASIVQSAFVGDIDCGGCRGV